MNYGEGKCEGCILFIYMHLFYIMSLSGSAGGDSVPIPRPSTVPGLTLPLTAACPIHSAELLFFSDVGQLLKWCFGMKGILLRLLFLTV